MAIFADPALTRERHPSLDRPTAVINRYCALCGQPTAGALCTSCTQLPPTPTTRSADGDALILWCDRCTSPTGHAVMGDQGTRATCVTCWTSRDLAPAWNPHTCPYTIVPDLDHPHLCSTCGGVGRTIHRTRGRTCTVCAGTGRA